MQIIIVITIISLLFLFTEFYARTQQEDKDSDSLHLLVEIRSCPILDYNQIEKILVMWNDLDESDKNQVIYSKRFKGKNAAPGVEMSRQLVSVECSDNERNLTLMCCL